MGGETGMVVDGRNGVGGEGESGGEVGVTVGCCMPRLLMSRCRAWP